MKAYRYMSQKEFNQYTTGYTIREGKHDPFSTENFGLVFLPKTVVVSANGKSQAITPIEAYRFFNGMASTELLVEFNVKAKMAAYNGSYGHFYDVTTISELCVPAYSRDTMVATRYHFPGDVRNGKPVWYSTGLV